MPDKSGLPSDVRGAGPVRFGLPSEPFGTPGFGYNGHCAEIDDERAITMSADTRTVNGRFMAASSVRLKACAYLRWRLYGVGVFAPANSFLPVLARVTFCALALFVPFFARVPSMVTTSPAFSVSRVQPDRIRPLAAASSNPQLATSPVFSSLASM